MALSPGDPHSYARPEFARVTDIYLALNVDFDRKVLKGKTILNIERICKINEVILDSYGLIISSVKNPLTGYALEYQIGQCGIFGSKFTVQLPQIVGDYTNEFEKKLCKIEIEYETSPNSPALYWLRPEQTADGKYPLLLSNNKYTYARSVFPCQDTPSVKFTYTAAILAPMDFSVLMSASFINNSTSGNKLLYTHSQIKPIPSYALIIVVGVLQSFTVLGSKICVWAEHKYIHLCNQISFLCKRTGEMLQTAEKVCGTYPWASLNICVLLPSVSHFEIECPSLIFVSPTLLGGDVSLYCSIARTISQHWAGILVTSASCQHLWLNKCFSMFIYRKLISAVLGEDVNKFVYARDLDDFRSTRNNCDTIGLLNRLLPKLDGLLPHETIRYVPYEKGYILLLVLQNKMGGTLRFETFLKSYLAKFAYKKLKTDNWMDYLFVYLNTELPNILREINSIDWNAWFNDQNYIPREMFHKVELTLENVCISLAERWISWDENTNELPFVSTDIEKYFDLQKIYFLNYLRASPQSLSIKKLHYMGITYQFNNQMDEIRFVWLRLCIKNRWVVNVSTALQFAIKFCSRKFTYPIFRDLYEWTDLRATVIMEYLRENWKMTDDIKEGVALILHVNS